MLSLNAALALPKCAVQRALWHTLWRITGGDDKIRSSAR